MTSNSILVHERLAIVGVETGHQPLLSEDGKVAVCANGEIYNHKVLAKQLKYQLTTPLKSDCEIILHLYQRYGADMCRMLDGIFSFILLDTSQTPERLIIARDPIGITTLYYGSHSSQPQTLYIASELKSIDQHCDRLDAFPPGHFYDSALPVDERLVRYYEPSWLNGDLDDRLLHRTIPADLTLIRTLLEAAVRKRLMSEVPFGVLLSGGLDSSLIASITVRQIEELQKNTHSATDLSSTFHREIASGAVGTPELMNSDLKCNGQNGAFPSLHEEHLAGIQSSLKASSCVHSFSIGLKDSPDLRAARQVANFLNTAHHEFTFTVQEGLDALPEVIYHLETYDVTTVRASTPMYLLSRRIKAMGVKMVLSGEGADEIFGGYLYFSEAPDPLSFYQETIKRVKNLHTADCLRANKSTMAWGLEARVPFLDKAFLELCMNIRPEDKQFGRLIGSKTGSEDGPRIEKHILRKAFDCSPNGKPYLPDEILWRQKEQFSDGVGYSWIDGLKAYAETSISDQQMSKASQRWPRDTPSTKEAYFIRQKFEEFFPTEAAAETSVRWVPRTDWGCDTDPSGRSVKIHASAYNNTSQTNGSSYGGLRN